MVIKEILKEAFSLKKDIAEHDEIKQRLISGGQVTGTNMCILMLAIFIASIGLNMNSTAIIIGAMLISPLMGSIMAMAYGTATADGHLFRKSIIGLIFQITICLMTSTLYFWISPISTTTSELLARTQPTIWDVLIAICGGTAGMIGMTRDEKSNVIPGVAIATALMPPLCTCGYSIACGRWEMLLGAGYLFAINAYFIFLSSSIVLLIIETPKIREISDKQRKKLKSRLIVNTVIMIIPSLIVAAVMVYNTNAKQESPLGFEQTVSIVEVTKQAEILFPEVTSIQIGSCEMAGADGTAAQSKVILLDISDDISEMRTEQLERWLREVYKEEYNIVYII